LFKCKVFEASASKTLHFMKSKYLLFMKNALKQWLNSSNPMGFDELQGFALRINRFAVYSVDIIVAASGRKIAGTLSARGGFFLPPLKGEVANAKRLTERFPRRLQKSNFSNKTA
jgi:hypothetical protein